jgi:hypothetical protein
VGSTAKENILAAKSDQLGSSQSRLSGDQQQGSVTASQVAFLVWSPQEGLNFGLRQKVDRPAFVTFAGNRQYPLGQRAEVTTQVGCGS